eukprot:GFUD01025004.1.p1 GENE.GFUD01025004.1~~GFUD01025004.1.p1  ORF type:complete len:586 (-),score=212.18 GFUD01025004.1:199-1956(-)
MAPKGGINVRVLTMDTELEFTILAKTTGKLLFDQVVQTTGLREIWYFGLQYTDSAGLESWLNLDKKVQDQKVKKEPTLQFKFRVRFYPENVADEIIQGSTLRLLFLQVKADILNETTYSPAEKSVLLASFATQAKYGNYETEVHEVGYLANDKILPEAVITGHKLSREEWENKISLFHAKHKGMTREDSMVEYLKIGQDLETYGISYYDISNKKGSELILGVDCLGINVYNQGDRLSPKINFPWSEINRISYKNNNFIVKLNDKKSPKFIGICRKQKMSKKIYELASGNHEMYMRRRRPDTLEVQQMKAQKRDEESARAKEKAELSKEIAARSKAEQMREEMEAKYKEMEKRMKQREAELEEANENIKRLEEQLRELREAKENLESQQDELKEMMQKLEEAKNLEAEERHKMEEEIKVKQEEIEEVRNIVEEKEKQARELQEEVELSKQKLEETTATFTTEIETQNGDASSVSSDEHDERDEHDEHDEHDNGSVSSEEKENSIDIPEIIVDPVEERQVEMNAEMSADLAELGKELEEKKHEENETDETKVYRENLRINTGADKYKTLREVRKGNTKRRIDNFENM